MLVFFITFAFGFSGYLLPWNELAFFATRVGTDMAGAVPGIGEAIVHFMRGGKDVIGATLTRFFGVHVAILPALIDGAPGRASAAHPAPRHERAAVRSKRPAKADRAAAAEHAVHPPLRAAGPVRLDRGAGAARGAVGVSSRGSSGKKADTFAAAPAGIRPEWYFLWMFQALKYMPATVLGMSGELLVLVPVSASARSP